MSANPLSPGSPMGQPSGMAPPPGGGKFRPIEPLRVLRQHVLLLIFSLFFGVGLGFAFYIGIQQVYPRQTSKAQLLMLPPLESPDSVILGGGRNKQGQEQLEIDMQNVIVEITSERVLRQAMSKPEVKQTAWFQTYDGPADAIKRLQDYDMRVNMIRGSSVIELAVSTAEKEDPPRILNAIIDVYLTRLNLREDQQDAQLRRMFLDQRERSEQQVTQLERQIGEFVRVNDIETLDQNRSSVSVELATLNESFSAYLGALNQAEASYQSLLQKRQSGSPEAAPDEIAAVEQLPEISGLTQQLVSLREQLRRNEQYYGANHYQTKATRSLVDAAEIERKILVDRKVREQRQLQLEGTAQQIDQLKQILASTQPQIDEARTRMTDLTEKITKYEQLEDQLVIERERADKANDQLQNINLKERHPMKNRVQLYGAPIPAELTFPPHWLLCVVGGCLFFVGLVTGILMLLELMDQRMKSPADMKLLATDGDLLGVLPDVDEDPSRTREIERVVERDPTGLFAEAFRELRTGVMTKMDRRGYKTLVMVSPQPGSGSSSVLHNLATSIALNGRRVLIVDANFRRPRQHELMDINNGQGLIDVLEGRATIEEVVTTAQDMGLSVMPTGYDSAQTPPEIFESQAFRAMLSELESRYDLILIDAPPVLLTTDSQMLAKYVDAIAMVVRAARDKRGMIDRALRRLDGHRADVLGIVLNGVQSAAGGYFRQNYRDFYRYSNDGKGKGKHRNGNGRGAKREPAAEEVAPSRLEIEEPVESESIDPPNN